MDEGREVSFRWSTDKAKAVRKEVLLVRIKYAMRKVMNARGGDIGVKPVWTMRAEPVQPVVMRRRGNFLSLRSYLLDEAGSFEFFSLSRGLA